MTVSPPPVSDLDLFDDDVLIDPYPSYAALRELGPVVHLPANEVYALTRYRVIRTALIDWESFSSVGAIGFNPMVNEALSGTSLASDPPDHTRLRRLVASAHTNQPRRGDIGVVEIRPGDIGAPKICAAEFAAV